MRTKDPSGPRADDEFSKSSRGDQTPLGPHGGVNSWPRAAGSAPTCPAGFTVFCCIDGADELVDGDVQLA